MLKGPGRLARPGVLIGLWLGAGALADDGPGARPESLRRRSAQAIVGGEVRAEQWRAAGGAIDGGRGAPDGFRARGVTLLSWLPLNVLPGDSEAAAGCTGYVSPSGREYAVVSLHNGTAFVEVSDPVNPRVVRFIGGPSRLWHDPMPWKHGAPPSLLGPTFNTSAATVGEYCYAGSDVAGGCGVQVIDLRRIDEGEVRHVRNWTPGGLGTLASLSAGDGRLYITGSNIGNGGLVCVDVSSPEEPVIGGAWTGLPLVGSLALPTLDGRRLVCGFGGGPAGSRGMALVDATDAALMRLVGLGAMPGEESCRRGAWMGVGRVIVATGEAGGAGRAYAVAFDERAGEVFRWRVRAIGAPVGAVRDVAVAGGLVFEAAGSGGLRVAEVGAGEGWSEIAYFDTHPEHDAPTEHGACGVAALPGGTVLVADAQRGLFVLRVERPGDLDGDGVVTGLDGVVLDAWVAAGEARADLDGDGGVDSCDLELFVRLMGGPRAKAGGDWSEVSWKSP